jgi:hypothetical protein
MEQSIFALENLVIVLLVLVLIVKNNFENEDEDEDENEFNLKNSIFIGRFLCLFVAE